jgi:uncharacterized protein (TIGR00661 family)
MACAGEGNGHAARVAALSHELAKHFDIRYFCPESVLGFLQARIPNGEFHVIPGLLFEKRGHSVDYSGSLKKLTGQILEAGPEVNRITRLIRNLGLTVMISDYEPYTAHAAASADIPLCNLNHPGVVLRYMSPSFDAVMSRFVSWLMMPPAQENIICSFYDGDVGPIIREELKSRKPSRSNHILVYVKESSRSQVLRILELFPDREFRIFPDRQADFDEAFVTCAGLIAPAGHQILSEALYLKKPVLAIPQIGQYEQRLNARMLKHSGWGIPGSIPTLERDMNRFFGMLGSFPLAPARKIRFRLTDDTASALDRIKGFVWRHGVERVRAPRVRFGFLSDLPQRLEYLINETA